MSVQLAEALDDRARAEEELRAEQDRVGDLAKELAALKGQQRTNVKIWAEEVSRLCGQLLVQQQWLPTIASFKLFQTSPFGEFLVGWLESFKSAIITKTLDDVMSEHPSLDFERSMVMIRGRWKLRTMI